MICVLLILVINRWLQSRHATLIRTPPERQAKVALTEPRPEDTPGAPAAASPDTEISLVSPADSRKEQR